MLAKKYILKDKKVFLALKHKGERRKVGPFLLSYFFTQGPHNRFGIVVSRRRVGLATKRNRIKRRTKGVLFSFKDEKTPQGFVDMAVVILWEPQKRDFKRLKQFLSHFFL